ncbi:unnamed protein product [Darwinula stevensoni]|uniref:BBSome complex member BBS5 PH domain-containing protein n=1 Tax=Darwinula stevensoni TaxID=69355 RepID=A0A7R8XKT8_9CRUS|nr:unnamed protein product [Darwinula stevensoni]CAG0895607.1 unnamed protein product [Darwinula stevensoni]
MACADSLWEDKSIRFDMSHSDMRMRTGEKMLENIEDVEDTKGNSGDKGRMIITNLRIIWHSLAAPRINVCASPFPLSSSACRLPVRHDRENPNRKLGESRPLNPLHPTTAHELDRDCDVQKLRGITEAVDLLTKMNGTRYEFIFTSLLPRGDPLLFAAITSLHKAYQSSGMYRELKLRTALFQKKHLRLLPEEQVCSKISGVWNLASDQGNLGSFVITNVRVIWYSNSNEHFNLSLPFLHVGTVKLRDSKFGMALVLETSEVSGGYVLGFRLDPMEKMKEVQKEISALFRAFSQNPVFGVTYSTKGKPPSVEDGVDDKGWDVEEISSDLTKEEQGPDMLSAYILDGFTADSLPVFSLELGFAVEAIKDGFTLKSLWDVVPQAANA